LADLTIIVVQHRRFPKSMLLRVRNAIVNVGGTVLGVVLNNVDVRHDANYEYYTSYYKYYSKPTVKREKDSDSEGKAPALVSKRSMPRKEFDY
jgi:hypothetical protein